MPVNDRGLPVAKTSSARLVACALALVVFAARAADDPASVRASAGVPLARPVLGVPVVEPTLIGSSPGESAGETWGYAAPAGILQIVRYLPVGGWQLQPGPVDQRGEQLAGFTPAPGPLAGATTPAGGVAILGKDAAGIEQLLVRNPGSDFRETPTVRTEPGATGGGSGTEANALLRQGESLFGAGGLGVLTAPVEEQGARTGVFVVPFESAPRAAPEDVLFYDGSGWTREPICAGIGSTGAQAACASPPSGFKVLGIGASSPTNAWLLAQGALGNEGLELFARQVEGGKASWTQRPLGGSLGAQFAKATIPVGEGAATVNAAVTPLANGQPLTVTGSGLWADGQLKIPGRLEPTDFTIYYSIGEGQVNASWCMVPAPARSLCTNPLESPLPGGYYRSFAWSGEGPYGTRVITGLGEGTSLSLQGASFVRVRGVGGESGGQAGAAFSSSQEGWLADVGASQLTLLSTEPARNQLESWPVPFRRPLTAIAEQPGAAPGELSAQAIAVGQHGQAVHYYPGQGWVPEALLNSGGEAQTPDLRGVAWPEPNRAYAVGTHGAMWLWNGETGLWEPDPARPPNLFLANFTGIAFDPSEPGRGYAIGQQGVLLSYGKTWEREQLPPGLEDANFTSVAFAGNEALVTYQIPHFNPEEGYGLGYSGGLLVNDGSGWRAEPAASELPGGSRVPERVAGLPDGGAVLAAGGEILERQAAGAPWQPAAAGPVAGAAATIAAYREGGRLRAIVSLASGLGGSAYDVDRSLEQKLPEGQAPIATEPYPLPSSGFLLRETANGWEDEEHEDFPLPNHSVALPPGQTGFDWPNQPDAVLALAFNQSGNEGWAVGGQTGEVNNEGAGEVQQHVEAIQTAGVMRYPAGGGGAAPAGFSVSPEPAQPGNATFAVGGDAQCASACADLADDQLGPDAWLETALQRAREAGVRAFLYTGPHVAPSLTAGIRFGPSAFAREQQRYSEVLSSAGESPSVYAAASESDLDGEGNLNVFESALGAHAPAGTAPPGTPQPPSGSGYYAFESTGGGGAGVRVIVLDYSHPALGEAQQCWLARQLASAKAARAPVPAIVLGNRGMAAGANLAADASQVIPTLVNGSPPGGRECRELFAQEKLSEGRAGASAYFYDDPQQNRQVSISAGGASIPTFGSGTLGYVDPPSQTQTEFLGASGLLLAEVELARRETGTIGSNRAPVRARLVPDISDLAIDATNGVLLRRSQPALFTALARRPHAGMLCEKASASCQFLPDPYVPIPDPCQGAGCATGIFPSYTFTSSNPDVGNFVEPDPASPDGTTVLQGADGKPIPDERSGLFCAYNAGTTTVTVHTGGLSSSERLTVLSGSVEQPCGTTPLLHPPAPAHEASLPVPLAAPTPVPASASPPSLAPPPPPPPVAAAPPPPAKAKPAPPPPLFVPTSAQLFPLVPLVPPPAPSVARPTPPSGTAQVPSQSPVSQQVSVSEREEEEQGAIQHVHNMAAYSHPAEAPVPAWSLGLILFVLAAGVGIRRRRGELAYARYGVADEPPRRTA
ncbi:MAG TPA: hypothetical protein VHU13_07610 [Solirubrobacteraceae bacterium]|jgi:hypothetical protein|nr:hypothetical protein [Solirubrobacteraceae bacterium]